MNTGLKTGMHSQTYTEGKIGDTDEGCFDAVVVGSGYGGSVAACRMSMAGIKVCLLEKGRRWNAEDFPTDTLKIMSSARLENRNLGISFGPKDALFQVYEENDSLAVVACGLGGGSLVNAGVMLPTPVRTRRNSKWPKEWEKNWDVCEASSAAMLRIQNIPVKFPIARVMDEIVGDTGETLEKLMKLSVNFDVEELPSNLMKPQQMNSCLACGNCMSGCPYNAKNSTDKNYLLSAFQAGCTVRTECQVLYVVENACEIFQQGRTCGRQKRWRVYLNEIDYITSDFVILSAGVFGTNEILFQSQMRGLRLSEALGSGFSCNGNTVAYLAGSPAPLNGYGLDREQVSAIPFQERPGPSISSSYTSSLGFTIQSAVLPRAYPSMMFKWIHTYRWPTGCALFHGIIDKLKCTFGLNSTQAIVLNAMGYDDGDGKITLDKGTNKLGFTPPHDPLLPRKTEAFQKLTKKLGGILFMSKYRSTSVHLLGGCNASSDSSSGVCNHNGQVFDPETRASVHAGLYVCDASLVPCSVGINPSLTIATAAEHVSRSLVQDVLKYKMETSVNLVDQNPCLLSDTNLDKDRNSFVLINETLRGYLGGMPCTAYLKMKMYSKNLEVFNEPNPLNGGSHPLLRGKVGGYVVFKVLEKDKLHIIDGDVDMCIIDERTPYTQNMHYRLLLVASSGSKYILWGKKIMNPCLFPLYAWKETTTLHVTLEKIAVSSASDTTVYFRGELQVSFIELLKSIMSLKGKNAGMFVNILLQTFVRTYVLRIPRGCQDLIPTDFCHKNYPDSILHKIKTEDGYVISCRQWKCTQNQWQIKGEKQPNPVLLLNGYSTENYALPTEPHDMVRTLLEEGHEIWLAQPRLHPLNPANSFTIDDIGKHDIPAVFGKILELHGPCTKIHVIAHCVGGLAFHIAIMGGYVKASSIASLTCTNSSMFFKLTTLPRVKMWLPLIPITMAILGKKTILPILGTPKTSFRHRLLKGIAHYIPRYELCSCKECEMFSGIFGNTFLHENLSPTMHQWLFKHSFTELPMGGFHHLRKICSSGFIVDSKGNNSYMIHPERMALSTLYISGGREVLVTRETSFLANKFMMLHQPGFRHERVVVEGFGHSDLLIGEASYKEVFPHILSHMRRAELEGNGVVSFDRKRYSKEVLDWGSDPYGGYRGFGLSVLAVILFLLLVLLYVCI
ncbi:Long-chain-alcohol oxidase FAO1 [Euphorbia peplus]|nr:Long-chain-alcohol oxidase FAO1 [Euphorbia peplus]